MFDHDIAMSNHFTNKHDGKAAYETWAKAVGIYLPTFSYSIPTGHMFKGKPVNFVVQSWGNYFSADGAWIIFVNYYAAPVKHTVQYNWSFGTNGKVGGAPRKYEFIA